MSTFEKPKRVEKPWGYELWWAQTDRYVGKLLHVKAAAAKAAPKGAYTIQVASSSSRADAERLAQKLAARRPRIAVADVAGRGRFYRVQIGTFESQEAARRQLAALARAGVAGIVTPAR